MKSVYFLAIFLLAFIYAQESKVQLIIVGNAPLSKRKGQKINCSFTVKNMGTAIVKDVIVRVKVPAWIRYKKLLNGVILRWNFESLAAKESKIIHYILDTPYRGSFENIALVYANGKACAKAKIKIRVIGPFLKIEINNPRRTIPYKAVPFTVTIINEGDATARNLKMIAALPRGLDYIRSSPRGVYRKGENRILSMLVWKIPEIKAGSKKIIRIMNRARLLSRGCCRARLAVKLISNDPKFPVIPITKFSSVKIIGCGPRLHVSSYDKGDPCEVGQQTIYIVECMNEDTGSFTDVSLNNHIPKEMKYVGAKGPTLHSYKDGIVYFKPVPIMQPGEKLTYTIICKAIAPGSATNTAVLRCKQLDCPIIDEEWSSVYKP